MPRGDRRVRLPPNEGRSLWPIVASAATGGAASWLLLYVTRGAWARPFGQVVAAVARALEATELTLKVAVVGGGSALEFHHRFLQKVPVAPAIALMPVMYGLAVWTALGCGSPGLPWRRRVRDLLVGWVVMTGVTCLSIVVAAEYAYAQLHAPPFTDLFRPVDRAMLYFAHGLLLDLGPFLFPLALGAALQGPDWARVLLAASQVARGASPLPRS